MDDADFARALREYASGAFVVRDVRLNGDATLEMRLTTCSDDRVWALVLPSPSACGLKPWLYAPPEDAGESVSMLDTFLDEEILTTAIYSARRSEVAGATLVELAPYGLRRDDDQEHQRIAAAAAAGGWDGRAGSGEL